ncbi:MAG: nitrilase-related carbon-nitrogen hydrolase, partial [Methanobacteriaceae archaeon]|nr:nitrilase-related carbon-nitrogen hydrolase [Methanobacteriaceae archaeon]
MVYNKFKLALCQMKVVDNKNKNIDKAKSMVEESSRNGVDLVILPEMFNCPYENSKFEEYSERIDNSQTLDSMSNAASEFDIHIIAGSIPEKVKESVYNTSFIFDNK